jgi:hypothetical protein
MSGWIYNEWVNIQWIGEYTVSAWIYSEWVNIQWVGEYTMSGWVKNDWWLLQKNDISSAILLHEQVPFLLAL